MRTETVCGSDPCVCGHRRQHHFFYEDHDECQRCDDCDLFEIGAMTEQKTPAKRATCGCRDRDDIPHAINCQNRPATDSENMSALQEAHDHAQEGLRNARKQETEIREQIAALEAHNYQITLDCQMMREEADYQSDVASTLRALNAALEAEVKELREAGYSDDGFARDQAWSRLMAENAALRALNAEMLEALKGLYHSPASFSDKRMDYEERQVTKADYAAAGAIIDKAEKGTTNG